MGLPGRTTRGMKMTLVVLVSLLLAAACASPTGGATARLGEEFSLAPGQSVSMAGEDLRIKFVEVTADSRCPTGATCIWQGEATCLVEMTRSGAVSRKSLTQPGLTEGPSLDEFADFRISFNIEPYPEVGKAIEKADYRLQLAIDRKQ